MTRRQVAALSVLCAAVFLVAVDGTVLSIAVPQLTAELNPTYTQILWIGDIYAFVLAGLLVTMGNVGDRIGHKRLLLISATCFGVMSVLAAVAPTPELLIVARALQGLAGAGLMPPTLALIREVFHEDRQRTKAIGIWSAAGAAGAAVGPTLAGFLLEHYYWGSVLLINVPVVVFIVGLGFFVVPEARGDAEQPLDPLSIALSIAGILLAVFGITELAHNGLGDLGAYVALIVAIPLLWWFYRRQRTLAVPLLDLSLFTSARFSSAIVAQFTAVFAATGVLFFVPIYLQEVKGFTSMQTGLALLPVSLVSMVAATNTGRLLARWGPRAVLVTGMLASGVGLVLVGLTSSQNYWLLVLPLAILGFGFGSVLTTASDLVLRAAPPERTGAATGVSETSYELGGALGIALLGSLLTVTYQLVLQVPAGVPDAIAEAASAKVGGIEAVASQLVSGLGAALTAAADTAFSQSLAVTTGIAGGVLVLAALAVSRMLAKGDRPH